MSYASVLTMMAQAERDMSALIAARAIDHPDPASAKRLRAMWSICNTRANYFSELAHDATHLASKEQAE